MQLQLPIKLINKLINNLEINLQKFKNISIFTTSTKLNQPTQLDKI